LSVHQTPSGLWFCKYYQDGKEKRGYFREGKQAAIDFNISLGLGKPRKARGPVFGDLVVDWLKVKEVTISRKSYISSLKRFESKILPSLGGVPAAALSAQKIDPWVTKRLQEVSASSVHRELNDIIAVLNFAVSRGRLTYNPLTGYRKPRPDDEIINPPTEDEVNSILAHAVEHLQRAIIISFYTGLRPGRSELLGLTQGDVDIKGNTIRIRSARKGGLSYRVLPLHPEFKAALLRWFDADGLDKQKHLITWRNKPVKSVYKAWITAKEKAGIKRRLRMYDLRHYFGTALLTGGTDLKTTSTALGHSNPGITLRTYIHSSPDLLKDAIGRLPSLVTNSDSDRKSSKIIKLNQKVK